MGENDRTYIRTHLRIKITNKFLLFHTSESKYMRIGTKAGAGHWGDTDINHDPVNPVSEAEPLSSTAVDQH